MIFIRVFLRIYFSSNYFNFFFISLFQDARNKAGETFESLIKPKKISEIANPLKYTTLACLAAKTIQKHNIKYHDSVPTALHKFIEIH